jgi:hypothetical protein
MKISTRDKILLAILSALLLGEGTGLHYLRGTPEFIRFLVSSLIGFSLLLILHIRWLLKNGRTPVRILKGVAFIIPSATIIVCLLFWYWERVFDFLVTLVMLYGFSELRKRLASQKTLLSKIGPDLLILAALILLSRICRETAKPWWTIIAIVFGFVIAGNTLVYFRDKPSAEDAEKQIAGLGD